MFMSSNQNNGSLDKPKDLIIAQGVNDADEKISPDLLLPAKDIGEL